MIELRFFVEEFSEEVSPGVAGYRLSPEHRVRVEVWSCNQDSPAHLITKRAQLCFARSGVSLADAVAIAVYCQYQALASRYQADCARVVSSEGYSGVAMDALDIAKAVRGGIAFPIVEEIIAAEGAGMSRLGYWFEGLASNLWAESLAVAHTAEVQWPQNARAIWDYLDEWRRIAVPRIAATAATAVMQGGGQRRAVDIIGKEIYNLAEIFDEIGRTGLTMGTPQ